MVIERSSLAAGLCSLAKTRVWSSDFENGTFIGGSTWLSSTTQQGCGYRCDGAALGSPVGRFNTPDPSRNSVHPGNPGSWNRYAYTVGDPVNRNDPRGLFDGDPDDGIPCGDGSIDYSGDNCAYDGGPASDGNGGGGDGGLADAGLIGSVTVTAISDSDQPILDDPNGWPGIDWGSVVSTAGNVLSTAGGCAANQLGLTDGLAALGLVLGQPILSTAGKFVGATTGTSPLSTVLSAVLPWQLPIALPAPTYAIFRGVMATSTNAGRVLGRWIPFVGGAILAWDAIQIASCTISNAGASSPAIQAAPPPSRTGVLPPLPPRLQVPR